MEQGQIGEDPAAFLQNVRGGGEVIRFAIISG